MNGKSIKNVFYWFWIEFLISFVFFFSLVFVDYCVVFFNVCGNRLMFFCFFFGVCCSVGLFFCVFFKC